MAVCMSVRIGSLGRDVTGTTRGLIALHVST